MKRIFAIIPVLLLLLSACSAGTPRNLPEELLFVDEKPVLLREDLEFAAAYEKLAYGAADKPEALFTTLAETQLCAELSEFCGEAPSPEEIAAEYDILLETVAEQPSAAQSVFYLKLREALPEFSDRSFEDAWTAFHYRSAAAAALTDSIADSYGSVADPEVIREGICENLIELSSAFSVRCCYPGMEDRVFLFETVS